MEELRRVLKPGGVLALTIQGKCRGGLDDDGQKRLKRAGWYTAAPKN